MNKAKTTVFYVLSFTWGLIMSLIGCLVFLVLMCAGYKPKKFHDRFYIELGEYWGGLELGPWFITDKHSGLSTRQHEAGHGFQNALLGPLMPFVVCIPSATRYWIREFKTYRGISAFCAILIGCFSLIGLAFLLPGIIGAACWSTAIGALILGYTTAFGVWLWFFERPKYEDRKQWPSYDSIWFEGKASEWGAKIYPTEEE